MVWILSIPAALAVMFLYKWWVGMLILFIINPLIGLLRKRIESTGGSMSEYNKLRASVGMAPAHDDDYCEGVAWVVVYDLFSPEIADECKRLPTEERPLFMMTCASYLSLLAKKVVESKFPPDSWRLITPLLEREFSKQSWYQREVMSRIFDSMIKHQLFGKLYGRYTKAPAGPWSEAVMATELAGFKLSYSTNSEFVLYVTVMSGQIFETIAKMAPSLS